MQEIEIQFNGTSTPPQVEVNAYVCLCSQTMRHARSMAPATGHCPSHTCSPNVQDGHHCVERYVGLSFVFLLPVNGC